MSNLRDIWARRRSWILGAIAVTLGALLLAALRALLDEVSYAEVARQVSSKSHATLWWAGAATALSYLVLCGYDFSALKYVGVRLRARTVLLTSFIAYALGNTVGLGVLTGGAVRMRLYTAAGVEAGRVARAAAFNAGAFIGGMIVFGAAGVLWSAPDIAALVHLPPPALRALAALLLAAVLAFILLAARRRELHIAARRVPLPPPGLILRQLLISAIDLAASAVALWVLLPAGTIPLLPFCAWYAIAITLGLLSHIPGGLGVFEAVILLACSGRASAGEVLGALVLYRAIYYVLPLGLAALLLTAYELRAGIAAPVTRAAVALSPLLLATLTFIAGGWLLVSGVTPPSGEVTGVLTRLVPLPLFEISHFAGSVAGFAMLVVGRGLLHRLDAAWWAATLLTGVAAVLALPSGIALTEASALMLLALLLFMSRRQFDRRAALFAHALEGGWWLSIAWVVGACALLLFFAYRDVEYQHELWWQFEFDAHAPRGLRALTAVVLIGLALALRQLFRPSSGALRLPSAAELDRAQQIVANQTCADAGLALVGDKYLMYSEQGDAFLMYGRQGRSWISLFDPVGPRTRWPELVWRFIEAAADSGARAVCYQVRADALPLYLDTGLRAFKLGEYAYVPLREFTLKGSKRASLRHAMHRAERAGMSFTVLAASEVAAALPQLRAVSDAWLAQARAREKGFSLGVFRADYLERAPLAVVRESTGKIIAFANLLGTEGAVEVSVDLMRQLPGAPGGTMDFMFTRLMLHFAAAGFERFALGMAPLAGMQTHELAPRWHRFGHWLFDTGESFYNFRGLRSFKEKFQPVWEPRYLAAPGGVAALWALADVTALIAGGLRGVIAK